MANVMNTRHSSKKSVDFYPTPPWALRALFKNHPIPKESIVWEPACGNGDMSETIKEYCKQVISTDAYIYDYWDMEVMDFLGDPPLPKGTNWIITNPPFNMTNAFVLQALSYNVSFAYLNRIHFLETLSRYKDIFSKRPPTHVYVFAERVPIFKGSLDPKGSSTVPYIWSIWDKNYDNGTTYLNWIAPCRKELEEDGDYDEYLY